MLKTIHSNLCHTKMPANGQLLKGLGILGTLHGPNSLAFELHTYNFGTIYYVQPVDNNQLRKSLGIVGILHAPNSLV